MYPQMSTFQILDEIYVYGVATYVGGRIADTTVYFKSYDPKTCRVTATFDKEGKRELVISERAVEYVKDAITGKFKYIKDPRHILFGSDI